MEVFAHADDDFEIAKEKKKRLYIITYVCNDDVSQQVACNKEM